MQAFLSFTQKTEKSGGTLFTVVSRRFYVFFRAFSAASVVQFFVIRTDGACLHSRFKISPGDYFETGNPADLGRIPPQPFVHYFTVVPAFVYEKACSKSAIRSSGFSRPTDKRNKLSEMPRFLRSSGGIAAWDIFAG